MKLFSLVWANLFRKKLRFFLTLMSLIFAFILFGFLQTFNVLLNSGSDFVAANRLVTQSRVSFTVSLPLRHLQRIEAVPGVVRVMHSQWFGAAYQEVSNQLIGFAVEPYRLRDLYPEFVMTAAQWDAFQNDRGSMIAGKLLADKYKWKIGDRIPMKSQIWPQQDGSKDWTFNLVGIYDGKDESAKRQAQLLYVNFLGFDEARQFSKGNTGTYTVKLDKSANAQQVAVAIDNLFANSPDETKTQSEKDFNLNFVKQIADFGIIINAILIAVFFTILMLTGNTMAQAVRERIPELAVLKTLGFKDSTVMWTVLLEAFMLIGLGALIGLSISAGLGVVLGKALGGGGVPVDIRVWGRALLAVVVLALLVGLPPALRAGRLKIVDALAGR
jgi:putative ABC transport system permease protein